MAVVHARSTGHTLHLGNLPNLVSIQLDFKPSAAAESKYNSSVLLKIGVHSHAEYDFMSRRGSLVQSAILRGGLC